MDFSFTQLIIGNIILYIIGCIVLYYIIKNAVRNSMLNAWEEREWRKMSSSEQLEQQYKKGKLTQEQYERYREKILKGESDM